jgi:hypothetical protein
MKTRLIDLLDAEMRRTLSMLTMQAAVEDGDFDSAMGYQFAYLYWTDEADLLFNKHWNEYWDLRGAVEERLDNYV